MSERLPEGDLSSGEALRVLTRALRYLAPFRSRVLVKLGFGLLSLFPMLLLPWPLKVLVDQAIEGRPISQSQIAWPFFVRPALEALEGMPPQEVILWAIGAQAVLLLLAGAGMGIRDSDRADATLAGGQDTATTTENEANAGFSLAGGVLGLLDYRWTIRLVQDLNHHYRAKLFERVQSLPMSAFDDQRIGDALYRVMYDTPSVTNGCFRILLTPILGTLTIAMTVSVLTLSFGHHPVIVGSGLALLPLALLVTLPFAGALRRRGGRSRKAGARTTSTAEEGMSNILAVQSLGGQGGERDRFGRDSWDSFRTHRAVVRVRLLAAAAGFVPVVLLATYAFLYTVDMVIAGALSRGDLILFLTYFAMIASASYGLGALWFQVQTSAAGLGRVFFLMDLPGERDAPGAEPLLGVRDGLRLEGVGLRYPDGSEALREIDVEARVGRVTALVGPAGAGKTSLAHVLCGYLPPTSGRVLVDGRDLQHFTKESLRSRIAFVFQETALFDETVGANIRLGNPEASEAEVRRAARIAGADEFIRELPRGYETRLGRGGGKLSVGQKQRLAIARALVRDAPVLVLDEPTSALDPATERRLMEALREAGRDRLVLVIAHRLSTVRAADEIVFLDGGRIVERGSHEELMAREGGAYRRFVELQSRAA